MTALLAMIVGVLAVGYAAWPLLRGRQVSSLAETPDESHEAAETEATALLAWSSAAGEIRRQPEAGGPFERTTS